MISLVEIFNDDKAKKQIAKFLKLQGKEVEFRYEDMHFIGTLYDVLISPIAKKYGSKYYTVTINRTAHRVEDMNKVKIKIYKPPERIGK